MPANEFAAAVEGRVALDQRSAGLDADHPRQLGFFGRDERGATMGECPAVAPQRLCANTQVAPYPLYPCVAVQAVGIGSRVRCPRAYNTLGMKEAFDEPTSRRRQLRRLLVRSERSDTASASEGTNSKPATEEY